MQTRLQRRSAAADLLLLLLLLLLLVVVVVMVVGAAAAAATAVWVRLRRWQAVCGYARHLHASQLQQRQQQEAAVHQPRDSGANLHGE
jgi:hypothetical protein